MLKLLLTLLLTAHGALGQVGEVGGGTTLTQGLALAPGVLGAATPPSPSPSPAAAAARVAPDAAIATPPAPAPSPPRPLPPSPSPPPPAPVVTPPPPAPVATPPPPAPVATPPPPAPVAPSPPPVVTPPSPAPVVTPPPPAPVIAPPPLSPAPVVTPPPPAPVIAPPPAALMPPPPPPAPVVTPPQPPPLAPAVATPAPAPVPATITPPPVPALEGPAAAPAAPSAPIAADNLGFIRTSGTHFVDAHCNEFHPVGWNSWRLIETGLKTDHDALPLMPSLQGGQNFAAWLFAKGRAAGLNTFRFFAIGNNNDDRNAADRLNYALQPAPGRYNETIFKEIDYIFDEAARNHLKVIVAPINNWELVDGVPSYLTWCTGSVPPAASNETNYLPFYTDPKCIALYKAHMTVFLNRVNTVNGRVYKNDPTIFAWDLINEPRCSGCQNAVSAWITMMVTFIKGIDANHMVTVGGEGFFGPGDPNTGANPQASQGATWPQQTGQDFSVDYGTPGIDFTAIHIWPDDWSETSPVFVAQWISTHVAASQALGKPLIVEEFGINAPPNAAGVATTRDPIFTTAYGALNSSLNTDGPLRGVLFWLWDARSEGTSTRTTAQGIVSTDSTWSIISDTAKAVDAIGIKRIPTCVVGGPPPAASQAAAAGRR